MYQDSSCCRLERDVMSLIQQVADALLEQCRVALVGAGPDLELKDRLSLIRGAVAALEQVSGKKTIVEHVWRGQAPSGVGAASAGGVDSLLGAGVDA